MFLPTYMVPTLQLLGRLSPGYLYRFSLLGTVGANFWVAGILSYVIRISGSKMWGAGW